MKLRRALALAVTAALLVPFALRARAQEAAAPAAGASAAPKEDVPGKKEKAKPRKKAAKGKKKAAESKYKSRALSESGGSHYRFDANGNPIVGSAKKAAKARTKSSSEGPEDRAACTDDKPCADKKSSDADAL